jgi:uncharacterized phage protein gp47/JayE
MAFELTSTGLSTQTQVEIVAELSAKLRSTFGNNLNTSVSSIMGQIVNIISEFLALDQQIALAVYRSFDPNSSIGVSLDRLAALTGSLREGATVSVVNGILTFSGAGTMNTGDLILNDDNSTEWELTDGPHTAVGPDVIDATFSAVETGPTLANANTNWSAITSIPNLDGFTNPNDDANVGQDQQTDPDFRVDRQVELYSQNQGPLLAIKAVVSKVPGVTFVRVYHNPSTQPADSDGIPFKAFNVVVETNPSTPGTALKQAIADAIFSAMGAGGEAFGTDHTETVVDVEGDPHPISFDVIELVDVFLAITLSTVGSEQALSQNIEAVTEAAVLAKAQTFFNGIGRNQLEFEYEGVVSELQASGQISGVTIVTVEMSTDAIGGPFLSPLPISIRQRPDFDSVNIVVTVTS